MQGTIELRTERVIWSLLFLGTLIMLMLAALGGMALAGGFVPDIPATPVDAEYYRPGLYFVEKPFAPGAWVEIKIQACVVETGVSGGSWVSVEPSMTADCR